MEPDSGSSHMMALLARIARPEGYECEVDGPGEKRWGDRSARNDDYFNYGFSEETWRRYCYRREAIRRSLPALQEPPAAHNCTTALGRLLLRHALARDAPAPDAFADAPDAVLEALDIDPRLQCQAEALLLAHPDLARLAATPLQLQLQLQQLQQLPHPAPLAAPPQPRPRGRTGPPPQMPQMPQMPVLSAPRWSTNPNTGALRRF